MNSNTPWTNWRKVILVDTNDETLTGLVAKLQYAGIEDGKVEMYHGKSESGDHIFVYSPRMLEIAGDILLKVAATPYDGEPSLKSMRKMK